MSLIVERKKLELPPAQAAAVHPVVWAAYAGHPRWQAARHLRWIGDQLLRIARGDVKRVCVSTPPRHGKTEFIARHFTSWWLGRFPEQRVIYVTMQERFSRRQGRSARDDYAAHAANVWGSTTNPRASTVEWDVFRDGRRTGGSMVSVGIGGTITGKGGDLVVLDDIVKGMKEARNDRLREEQWEWWESVINTRLEPGGSVVILQTRWHHDDIIGRLMKKQRDGETGEPWEFTNLPALAEEGDPLGRAPGEALWPARYPVEALAKKKKDVGPVTWEALYQGHPTPTEGSILKKIWFRYYELGPRLVSVPNRGTCAIERLHKFATVDLAASKKRRADNTAIAVWGFHPEWKILLLLDLVADRLGGDRIIPEMLRLKAHHKTIQGFFAEREGPYLTEKLGNILKDAARAGLPIVELTPGGDKESRLIAATGPFAAEQVWFPKGADWLAEYEEELLTFPESKHDDRVDVTSYGVGIFSELVDNRLALEAQHGQASAPPPPPPPPARGSDPYFQGRGGGDWSSGARGDVPW